MSMSQGGASSVPSASGLGGDHSRLQSKPPPSRACRTGVDVSPCGQPPELRRTSGSRLFREVPAQSARSAEVRKHPPSVVCRDHDHHSIFSPPWPAARRDHRGWHCRRGGATIPNTDVLDTARNREVVAFVERYRKSVEGETRLPCCAWSPSVTTTTTERRLATTIWTSRRQGSPQA